MKLAKFRSGPPRRRPTEVMTAVITRPPKGYKLWKVLALAEDGLHSWECEVLEAVPQALEPKPIR